MSASRNNNRPSRVANLFFATRPGQIRNIATYIAQAGRVDNFLIVLTTENEAWLRSKLKQTIPFDLFEHVGWPILPGAPAERKGVVRRMGIFRAFESAIDEAAKSRDGFTRVRVHLFHPSAYYPYVLRILAKRGIEVVSSVMLEEGLSTYKWCALPYELDTYGRAAGVRNVRDVLIAAKDAVMPPHLRFGIVDRFDEGWFRFPNAMANARQVTFGRLERLEFNAIPALGERLEPLVEEAPKVLFIGQRFGDCGCAVETALSLLDLIGCTEVLYKAHPTESTAELDAALDEATPLYPNLRVKHVAAFDEVPAETLVASGHFSLVVSLTSTALIYARRSCLDACFVSLAKPFLELYPLLYEKRFGCEMPAGHLRLLQRDAEVFECIAQDVEVLGKHKPSTCL